MERFPFSYKMAIRLELIVFAGLTRILPVAGPPNAHILLAGTAGILQVAGPAVSHKASNIDDEAPLIDQLLESLSVAGCTRLGRLARAALKRPSQALVTFAKTVHGKNAERNLHRWASKQCWYGFLPEPFDFEIKIKHLGGRRKGTFNVEPDPVPATKSALLPHEVFHSIFKHAPDVWEYLLGDMQPLRGFGEAAANAGDEWYRLHPVVAGVPAELRIPMGIHGDDAGVHGGEQVLVISWNGVTFKRPTLDSRIVFTMLRVANIGPDTMTRIYEVLKWSFDALASGCFPAKDPWGKAFGSDYMPERARVAGNFLAQRPDGRYYRGAFAEFRGDWKYLK